MLSVGGLNHWDALIPMVVSVFGLILKHTCTQKCAHPGTSTTLQPSVQWETSVFYSFLPG